MAPFYFGYSAKFLSVYIFIITPSLCEMEKCLELIKYTKYGRLYWDIDSFKSWVTIYTVNNNFTPPLKIYPQISPNMSPS